jgi:NAD(P)-dependent dehydrogenase (short-subunit alcohol dehydrogenase family)
MTTEPRTALITGASSGLGAAIAVEMATSRFHWLEETDTRWLRSEIETNLIGPMVVTHRALAPLLAAGTEADIVMMSSDATRRPRPGQLAYGASKAGLENYSEALSLALEGRSGRSTGRPSAFATRACWPRATWAS